MQISRESIFFHSIRAFCVAAASLLGFGVVLFLIILLIGSGSNTVIPPTPPQLILSHDHNGNRTPISANSDVILRFNIHGVIGMGDMTAEKLEHFLLSSREGALGKDRVKAIILHINTPGGSATDSDDMYNMLMRYKQKYQLPIYAFVDGLCASGGMYIACAADHIISTPSSIIGSVGVRMGPFFNFSEAMDSVGIHAKTLKRGIAKDGFNPTRPWAEDEGKSIDDAIADNYDLFVAAVSKARPKLTKHLLETEYGAQVYAANAALSHGYIDAVEEHYIDALKKLAEVAELGAYQVICMHSQKNPFADVLNGKQSLIPSKIEHSLKLGDDADKLHVQFR